jgi:hypothetical protein
MRIDFLSTEGHYKDHLQPIWDALPDDAKGSWFQHAPPEKPTGNITLVCSYGNTRLLGDQPYAYIEHGVGFSFFDVNAESFHKAYVGAKKRDGAVLLLNNNELTQDLNAKGNPGVRNVIVGTPKMDAWASRSWDKPEDPVAVYSTHWDYNIFPETRSAHKEFRWALRPDVWSDRFTWNGHCHPRGWAIVKNDYQNFYIPAIQNFSDVLDQGSVYVADATSTLYEFAYTGKPVVTLNASFYRRDVKHGLRFWDYIPGLQADDWQDVRSAVERSLDGEGEKDRARAVDVVYPIRDGTASKRAADALCELL